VVTGSDLALEPERRLVVGDSGCVVGPGGIEPSPDEVHSVPAAPAGLTACGALP